MKFFLSTTDLGALLKELRAGLQRLSFGENFHAFQWQGDIDAGEEVAIPNTLEGVSGERYIPSGVLLMTVEGPDAVSKGPTDWTYQFVFLKNRASTSTVTVRAIFFK